VSRFFVTGASGFIGSAVMRRLSQDNHEVIAPGHRELDLLAASIDELAETVGGSGVTHCIHCAWYTNHADYLVHDINRQWLEASLRLARACENIRFVGLGTCLEYDLSGNEPCAEDSTPLAPETLYARCKRAFGEALDGDCVWARVFFVYGPGDRVGRLVPDMIQRFSRGEAAGPTYGGLRRDYIHVDDLADQIVRIANSHVRGGINTGTGQAPSLSEIFAAGAGAFGRPELADANDETGGQLPLIQADMEYFRWVIGEPHARDIATGLRHLVG